MPVELSEAIAAYFAAENASDSEALAQCFAEHAATALTSRNAPIKKLPSIYGSRAGIVSGFTDRKEECT